MIGTALKHEALYDQLWEELARLSPGDKFLSVREIMRRYSVSQLTADKTLMRFREDGYLKVQAGKGLFASELVGKLNAVSTPTYLLAVPQWVSSDIDILETTVARLKPQYRHLRLLVHKFDVSANVPPQLPLVEENVHGLIILPSAGELGFDDIQRLKSLPCPVVVLGRKLDSLGFPCVGTDDIFAGNLAAHHLIEHGHRNIAVLLSEPHNRIIMNRVKAIRDYAELRGATVRIIDCEVNSGEFATDKAYHRFSEVIRQGIDFTAMVGISGESTQGAVNACLNHHIRIPADLSLVAIGNEKLLATFHPPLDAVGIDFAGQVEKALRILDDKVNGVPVSGIRFDARPRLIERGSVKNLNIN